MRQFYNILPFPVYLYHIPKHVVPPTKEKIFLGIIPPKKILKFEKDSKGLYLTNGDEIYFFYNPSDIDSSKFSLLSLTDVYTLLEGRNNIVIGSIVYDNVGAKQYLNAPSWDINGIWFINRLAVPITVKYLGNIIINLPPYNGLEYMGGGASSIYFDNFDFPLRIGDEFIFYITPSKKEIGRIKINDNFTSRIFIGQTEAGNENLFPNVYSYRVNEPNINSISYFIPCGNYLSYRTNGLI